MSSLIAAIVLLLLASAPQEPTRLVAASNVRLRAEPSEEVRIVATLPLGALVTEVGATPDGGWIRVRTAEGVEGWSHEPLTRRVPPGQFLRVAEHVIRQRLHRQGDGFASWIALQRFIDSTRHTLADREAEGRFVLHRFEAIKRVAQAGERYQRPVAPAFAQWLADHREMLVRNEPGGVWMIRHGVVFAEQERFKGLRAADELAWFAVTNGLPGECEGDVACYLFRDNLLEGEYLRRLPGGNAASIALRTVRERATYYREDLVSRPALFNPHEHCAALVAAIAPVRAAVSGVDASRPEIAVARDRAIEALGALQTSCG